MISGSSGKEEFGRSFLFFTHLENRFTHTLVAQQVEHPAVNREVEGSSPSMGANKALTQRNRHSSASGPGMAERRGVFSVIPLKDG